jgi:hypothetical protein
MKGSNMTVIIQDKNKEYTLTVKKEFLEKCPNPHKYTMMELNKDFNCLSYLHNEIGPAAIRHRPKPISELQQKLIDEKKYFELFDDAGQRYSFWVDGRCISREDPVRAEKMWRDLNFKKAVDEFIDSSGEPPSAA